MNLLEFIERIIFHLKNLNSQQQASTVDHVLVMIAGISLIGTTLFNGNQEESYGLVGRTFAPYFNYGLTIVCIFGTLLGCNFVVYKLNRYE